jgi:hypothetical protein
VLLNDKQPPRAAVEPSRNRKRQDYWTILAGMERICIDCPRCGTQKIIAEEPTEPIEVYRMGTKDVKCSYCGATLEKTQAYLVEE